MTANQDLFDAQIRHQIELRGYSSYVLQRVNKVLDRADKELAEKLRARLPEFDPAKIDFTSERWKALLADIAAMRAAAAAEIDQITTTETRGLAKVEAAHELATLQAAIPIEIELAAVDARQIAAIAMKRPFQGKLLSEWLTDVAAADKKRIAQAVQLGMSTGEPVDEIVRRIIGTRKNKYADGIVAMNRRGAQAMVRTAINHVSNAAREQVMDANSDIIACEIWTSTLDGRTTAVCRARDGKGSKIGGKKLPEGIEPLVPNGARPPAHVGCRSLMIAYIDGVGLLGDRPQVVDVRTRQRRDIDFRAEAKASGRKIQDIRKDWAEKNVGSVPAETTYQQFLERQSVEFQEQVLGKAKAALFRKGGLKLDQFIDRAGNELTLKQLAERVPGAFRKAGIT